MTYNEDSPCKLCLVRAACNNPCTTTINYVRDKILDFKPKGSVKSSRGYLELIVKRIIEKPTSRFNIHLAYPTKISVRCIMTVEDLSIVSITECI